jgi:hypothetical protein
MGDHGETGGSNLRAEHDGHARTLDAGTDVSG